jgi:hypothetical protein
MMIVDDHQRLGAEKRNRENRGNTGHLLAG